MDIPAKSSIYVYLVFYNKGVNLLNNYTVGESSLINPEYDDGESVFLHYSNTGLIGSGENIMYPTNDVGLYFYTEFYNSSSKSGNQGLVGWSIYAGIGTPMFAGLSNTSYFQPYYYINGSHYLSPKLDDGHYYLLGTAFVYPKAYWTVNGTVVQMAENDSFSNFSDTYVRPTGVNISVLYSYMTLLPPNNIMPTVSFDNNTDVMHEFSQINSNSFPGVHLYIKNNPNGYTIYGDIPNILIVRYGYFSGMKDVTTNTYEISVMGGLNCIIVSNAPISSISIVSSDYNLLIAGVIIYVGTITACAGIIIFKRNKEKKLKT